MSSWTAILPFGWFAASRESRTPTRSAACPESPSASDPLTLSSPSFDQETIHARDAAWVLQIASGDTTAFKSLFDTYAPVLVRLATGYVHSSDIAQDIVQEVFIAVWNRRASLQVTGHVAAYLVTATRNRALKEIRSATRAEHWMQEAARNQLEAHGFALSVDHLADSRLEADEFQAALAAAISALPDRQREVLLLHREQGLGYALIAQALGVSVPSVYNTMSRALARLRDSLSDLQ